MSTQPNGEVAALFLETARIHLVKEYLPKILACADALTEEEFWWRASEGENSVGNLLLHLSGNMRQWILSGLGGEPDVRNRSAEFAERGGRPKAEVVALFRSTVLEADAVLARFDAKLLTETRRFQKWDHSCLYAISHVVEHVAQHMGQIIFITKLRTKRDLRFFDL
jgi:uncharacterized damage-inducible protein DinB